MSRGVEPLRVGYELTALALDAAGPARAALGLRAALERRPDVEVVELAQPDGPGGRVRRGLGRELRWFPVGLPRAAARRGLDVLHCPMGLAPARAPVALVVTANDALAWEHPAWMSRALVVQQRLRFGRALRSADGVIAPSAHAAAAIAAAARVPHGRIEVIPYGVDEHFTPGPPDGDVLSRLGVEGPFVLTVGTLQPRKNLDVALGAWDRVAGHRLVIAGARGWRDDALAARLNASSRVDVLGRVSDEELLALYRAADCLLHPSREEGFGFPPLEAMACGTPVVAARAGSLPEVVGDAAVVFDPGSPEALIAALGEVLASEVRRAELRERGLRRAAGFTWDACAERTVAAYRAAISRRRSRSAR